jgi:hypothetical protein
MVHYRSGDQVADIMSKSLKPTMFKKLSLLDERISEFVL